jgi:hypothetical protein
MAASYTRQLEDACLILWERMGTVDFVRLRKDVPALADFLAHLSHSISHEEAMVRRNFWAEPVRRLADQEGNEDAQAESAHDDRS